MSVSVTLFSPAFFGIKVIYKMKIIFKTSLGFIVSTTIVPFLGLFLWSAYRVFIYDQAEIYAEHGLLENMQAIILAVAMLAFLGPAVFENRSDKLILLFCALLCYSFVLRELDVKRLDIHEMLIFIGSGVGRKVTLAAAFIAIAAYASFRFTYYKNAAVRFLRSWPGILLMMGGGFLLIGEFFEKNQLIIHHAFFEEISELFGYICILLSAFTVRSPN